MKPCSFCYSFFLPKQFQCPQVLLFAQNFSLTACDLSIWLVDDPIFKYLKQLPSESLSKVYELVFPTPLLYMLRLDYKLRLLLSQMAGAA